MRLINVNSLLLEEFFGDDIPPYAILSHTWGREEVSYQDWQDPQTASRKAGYSKIKTACGKAASHGLTWLWVDTNCIDKTSSSELTEAINSMFQWYARSEICYAYLSDVVTSRHVRPGELMRKFKESRWFTRGWTLQELLAPKKLTFYAADWSRIGYREQSLAPEISSVTGISITILTGDISISKASIARRMSWLSNRVTTRTEDLAYCMLGLFNINMPLLYGEGNRAFVRLQEEIIKVSNDHTIFCWSWTSSVPSSWVSLLAPSPDTFRHTGHFIRNDSAFKGVSTYSMTNAGLSIKLPVLYAGSHYMIVLQAAVDPAIGVSSEMPCIPVAGEKDGVLYRLSSPSEPVIINYYSFAALVQEPLLIMARRDMARRISVQDYSDNRDFKGFGSRENSINYCVMPLFDSTISWKSLDRVGIFGLRTLQINRSTNIDCALFDLGRPNLDAGANVHYSTCIFVAVRTGKNSTEWFCQILDGKDSRVVDILANMRYTTNRKYNRVLQDISSQVLEAEFEQTAHYNEQLGLSAVIGGEIHPFGRNRQMRVLHVSKGRTKYKSTLRQKTEWDQDIITLDKESEAGSNVAMADVDHEWVMIDAPREGGFKIKHFS